MTETTTEEDVVARAEALHSQTLEATYRRASRVFAALMVVQWLFGIAVALVLSPRSWAGRVATRHIHVYAAVFLGAAISSLPLWFAIKRPADPMTRHVVAVGQMLWSALLIHLTGGRIETHFHVFGSLAFLAVLYRDWRVLIPASVVVAADHFIRGIVWPESVYGIQNPEWWRFLEHAFWVGFEDVVLIIACVEAVRESRVLARRRAELEMLAASVGHRMRNPLASIKNASVYIAKRSALRARAGEPGDPKVDEMLGVIEKEIAACSVIVTDLVDFARMRPPSRQPCPLRELADQAIRSVPHSGTIILNDVPADLPVPDVDPAHFLRALTNLIRNAVEAQPNGKPGKVVIAAEGGGAQPWTIRVRDEGRGIPDTIVNSVFDPLFTTKNNGTGLGLAIVAGVVEAHHGRLSVQSKVDAGTTISIELPARRELAAGGIS